MTSKTAAPNSPTPTIHLTAEAGAVFREALEAEGPDAVVLLQVDRWYRVSLSIGPREAEDLELRIDDIPLCVDAASSERIDGATIDYLVEEASAGFKIDNPNAPPPVREIAAAELAERRQAGELPELFDVRTLQERAIACIDGARHFDEEAAAYLERLPRDTPIVFACHHGVRSRSAAEHHRSLGFTEIYNLTGGIEAWSLEVDPTVPRY